MRRTCSIVVLVPLAAVLVGGLPACGGGDPTVEERARAAVEELQEAYRDRHLGDVCARLTRAAQLHVGDAAHDAPTTCGADMQALVRMIEEGRREAGSDRGLSTARVPPRAPPEIDAVAVRGRNATAIVRQAHGAVARVPLTERGGEWRIDALYGGMPAAFQEDKFPARSQKRRPPPGKPPPADTELPPGGEVAVTDRKGPCPPIVGARTERVSGGCRFEAVAADTDSYVLSAVEELVFGRCDFVFDVHVDARGRVAMQGADMGGFPPCSDVTQCFERRRGRTRPWPGRIVPDGDGLMLKATICLDSCLGRFEGRVDMRLRRAGGTWRVVMSDESIGTSGWKLDGQWDLPPTLRIVPSAAQASSARSATSSS
jgi:hypothetical protein